MKKFLFSATLLLLLLNLTGCKISVLTNDGETAKIEKDYYAQDDFSKMSKEEKIGGFFTDFEVEYKYAGLPSAITEEYMTNTVTGKAFANDFCKENSPYLVYTLKVNLKNGGFEGEDGYKNYYYHDVKNPFSLKVINGDKGYKTWKELRDGVSVFLTCDEMPKDKTVDAWIRTKSLADVYKNKIDKMLSDSRYSWDKLHGIDIDSMKGIVYASNMLGG